MSTPVDAPVPSERSHYTRRPAPWLAGCSDVGRKHRTNQDAMCLAVSPGPDRTAVVAVADGVSTASGAEIASLVATETACTELVQGVRTGAPSNVSLVQAFGAANAAIHEVAGSGEPSACTLVAAVVSPGRIIVGNIGDSRAYWLSDDGACRILTTDDSMAQARIMLGVPRDEAERSNQAHSITKWLGRSADDVSPAVTAWAPEGNGWLMLCTDGLWNYASSPEAMDSLWRPLTLELGSPDTICEALVSWAREQGGRDNITVALTRYES